MYHIVAYLDVVRKQLTRIGRIPQLIKGLIGGFLSEESNFLTAVTAWY